MPRLIELPATNVLPARLTVGVGDVLWFGASGGRVVAGADAIEMLGAFGPAVASDDGRIVAAAGPPNAVLFRARSAGTATLELVTGDPFGASARARCEILVT